MTTDNTPSPQDRIEKAVLWGVGGWIVWNLLAPETKASIYSWLGQLNVAWQRETERQRALAEAQARQRLAQQFLASMGNLELPASPPPGMKLPAGLPVTVTAPI